LKAGFWVVLVLGMAAIGAMAAEPIVTADLDLREAWVGDPVNLTIEVHFDDAWDIELFEFDEHLDEAHILSQAWSGVSRDPETQLNCQVFRAQLAWYELGEFRLENIGFQATPEAGSPVRLSVPDLDITINAMLENDDALLAPPKQQIVIPTPMKIGLILAVVLGILAMVGTWVYFKKRPKKAISEPTEPRLPPFDEALANLKELTHGSLLKEGRSKAFYVEISQIVDVLYGRLFHVPAPEMTSFEVDECLRDQDMEASLLEVNASFHELCDAVKFARYEPKQAENTDVVNWAHSIIELLKSSRQEDSHVAAG